jgi:hypothetical protein
MSERPRRSEAELVELIRAIDVPAPERLHRRTEAMIAAHASARSGGRSYSPRLRLGAVAGLAAAAAVVLALVLGAGGGGSSFDLRGATTLALARATRTAPVESASRRSQLAAAVDGVAFPYWGERFGWRSTGSRSDRLGGRSMTTVFYSDGAGQRIGYAIVAGTPAPHVAAGAVHWRGGTPFRLTHVDGSRVVTWLRDGHLCIVAGRGVSSATLLTLASWQERDTAA